jgi:glycosyltransferase involved in cell wall biosynthesis
MTVVLADSEGGAAGSIRVVVLFSTGAIGGAERSLTRMALACSDPTIAYRLATIGAPSAWSTWVSGERVKPECFTIFGGRIPSLRGVLAFVKFCHTAKPDIVYAIGLRAAWIARVYQLMRPRLRVVHGIRSTYPPGSQLAAAFRRSETILHRLTSAYIANTRRGAADLLKLVSGMSQGKMSVIYNGVAIPEAAVSAAGRDLTIVVVANISSYKGHEAFLDVVECVRRVLPAITVLFVGRNDSGPSLEAAIKERRLDSTVRLLGYHPRPDEVVRGARVVALPSPQIEGCPTAVLEAMAMGIPVVAYRLGGLQEVIESGKTGILIERGDTQGYADALLELLQDTDVNDHLGRHARIAMQERFTIEACAKAHARAWHAVLQSPLGRATK